MPPSMRALKPTVPFTKCIFGNGMATHALTVADQGALVRSEPGDLVRIDLPENPTTGVRWQFVRQPGLAKLVTDTYIQLSDAVGAASLRRLELEVFAQGSETFHLVCVQAWDTSTPASAEFEFTLQSKM